MSKELLVKGGHVVTVDADRATCQWAMSFVDDTAPGQATGNGLNGAGGLRPEVVVSG